MLKGLPERAASEAGVTMAEVLVVMLITGILAAFAVPSFLGQRSRSNDTGSKVVARAAAAAMDTYANDNLGAYDGATGTILNTIDPVVPASTQVTGVAGCSTNVCYVVTTPPNAGTGTTFSLSKMKDGSFVSECDTDAATAGSQHGKGGCPADGHWHDD